jgi:hypothetical protein
MAEKLTEEQIVSAVNQEFEYAICSPGGEIALEQAENHDYYLSKKFGNEDDEISEVVTSDASEVVDGMMPSLLRMFTTSENLVSFDPEGPGDEDKAEQESDYCSFVFFKRNPAFEILHNGFHDALVAKIGVFKAWWDKGERVTTETYEGLTDNELYDLAADDELEIVEREEREEYIEEMGGKVTLHDVQFRRVENTGRVTVENVPPEEYRISSDARSLDPCKARMVGHEREVTRDELLAMGFDEDIVDELPADGGATVSPMEYAREDKSDDRNDSGKSPDRSQDRMVLREAYIKIDADGDGRSELLQIFVVGTTLLSQEPADRQPFHMICPYPLPHKHVGRSAVDKVKDIQLVNSTILRQTLANLYHSNQPGHGVWEQGLGETTMDDLLTTKVGRVVTFERPVSESYAPMVVPFVADHSFKMLEYFDRQKADRTGISSDAEGLTPDSLKHVQKSVMAQSVDLSKMKVETVARVFAETGLKTLFMHIHELVLKYQQKPEIVRLRGRWVRVDPREWRQRYDMTINVGLGISTREQSMIYLDGIWEKQMQMVQGGGLNLTVKPKHIYNTAAEMVKNANYKMPEMFFQDPGDAPAPPPSNEAEELKKRELALQERQQQLDMERQQVKAAELELKTQEQQLRHQREVITLEEKAREREDKYSAANEKLRTELLEIRLEKRDKDRDYVVREAEAAARIGSTRAQERKTNAEAAQVGKEAPDPGPDPLEQAKLAAEVERTHAQTEKERAAEEKLRVETEAQRIENRAAEEGINEMLEDDDGESEETE